jgi:hypothetical protein
MLQRTTLTPPMSQPENPAAGQATSAQTASWLRYYLILIALVSIIACTFIWQANDIQNIQRETSRLGGDALRLEEDNSRLMVELAQLDSPANIEREAARLGIALDHAPKVMVTPAQFMLKPATQQNRYAAIPEQVAGWALRLAQRGQPEYAGQGNIR